MKFRDGFVATPDGVLHRLCIGSIVSSRYAKVDDVVFDRPVCTSKMFGIATEIRLVIHDVWMETVRIQGLSVHHDVICVAVTDEAA